MVSTTIYDLQNYIYTFFWEFNTRNYNHFSRENYENTTYKKGKSYISYIWQHTKEKALLKGKRSRKSLFVHIIALYGCHSYDLFSQKIALKFISDLVCNRK